MQSYFSLLKKSLFHIANGHARLHVLKKVIGFEVFHITGENNQSLVGTFNTRNPAYLLSRISHPNARHDPKFLPLVCPFIETGKPRQYCHYRRISIANDSNAQLFVYPPVDNSFQSKSHSLISKFFKSLTPKSDPWIRERTNFLYTSVFGRLVQNCQASQIRLLDVGCGSGQVTVGLCKKAFHNQQKSFGITLIDVVERNKNLAKVFYRNPQVFRELIFRQSGLGEWLDGQINEQGSPYDIALMLRVLDLFSLFRIEPITQSEIKASLNRKHRNIILNGIAKNPAELICNGRHREIQHTIKKIALRQGDMFWQISLSDYFMAMSKIMGNEISVEDNRIYTPIRCFGEKALILPSGRSLIAQLMSITNQLVIEDSDATPGHLRDHFDDFGLNNLRIVEVGKRTQTYGAAISLIKKAGS